VNQQDSTLPHNDFIAIFPSLPHNDFIAIFPKQGPYITLWILELLLLKRLLELSVHKQDPYKADLMAAVMCTNAPLILVLPPTSHVRPVLRRQAHATSSIAP
jgi:hypothetical protein